MIITNFKQLEPFRHKSGIYIFINKKDPTKCYCGKSSNRLYRRIAIEHNNANGASHQYIDRVIRKCGLMQYFVIELIHWWDEPVDNLEVLALEIAAIDAYNCLVSAGGYNHLLFGSDRTGTRATNITKKKMSISGKLKFQHGFIHPNKGMKFSQETCQKMSQSRQGTNNGRFDRTIYQFKNSITHEKFRGTQYDFRIKYGLNATCLNEVIKGVQKSTKNWILV